MESSQSALASQSVIRLEAVDPALNVARAYTISQTADLFGWVIVTWAWGRIGQGGQQRTCAFASQADALVFTRRLLARRASAQRRIGVAYRAV